MNSDIRSVEHHLAALDAKESVLGPLSPVDAGRRVALRNRLEQLYREENEGFRVYSAIMRSSRAPQQAPRSVLAPLGIDEVPGRGGLRGYAMDWGGRTRNRRPL